MKIKYKIFSIFLSVIILFVSVFHFSFVSYAYDNPLHGGGGGADRIKSNLPEENETFGDWYNRKGSFYQDCLFFLVSEMGSLATFDFAKFYENGEAFKNDIEERNASELISLDEDTGKVTFSEDLVSYIKQALQEYSEETNGFWLVPTTSMRALQPQYFASRESYISLQNLINKYGIIALMMKNSSFNPSIGSNGQLSYGYFDFFATDFSSYLDPSYSFVNGNGASYDPSTAEQALFINIYNSDWQKEANIERYYFSFMNSKIYSDIKEGESLINNSSFNLLALSAFYVNYPEYNNGYLYGMRNNRYNSGASMLISKDGCRLRVFKSETAMKMYDAGQRTVYFTESFYNDDAKAIHVAVDDLENFMNVKYDRYFDDLRKLLAESGNNLSEAEIEKLTAQVLGELKHNSGLIEEGNQISGYWLERIYKELAAIDEMIAAKLDSIIEYLKKIKNWTIADTIVDGVDAVSDIISLITGILDDVDNGVGTAVATVASAFGDGAELMSKKFPFSVPWDLLFFVTLLASEPEVPHFEIPIDFDVSSLDIAVHYDFIVDFTEFQYLSDIFRTVLSMTYCVGLIKMTSGIVSIKKEE